MAKTYIIPINPMPAPRMVYSDRYGKKGKRRPVVMKYHTYKDSLRLEHGINFGHKDCEIELMFEMPMPKSWSEETKAGAYLQPHQQTPDIDNLVKGFLDAVCEDDRHIYKISAIKIWSDRGRIICRVFEKQGWLDRMLEWWHDVLS